MLRLLITAADYPTLPGSPWTPTAERIHALARVWADLLPAGIGDGSRVEALLRTHLWSPPLDQDVIADELRVADAADRADAEDRAAEAVHAAEAGSMLRSLREQYRGREHEAGPLVRALIA
jgi:hypothetical protein